MIKVFKQVVEPLSKEEMFRLAHNRSIKRLRGDFESYITEWDYEIYPEFFEEDYSYAYFGINGSIKLKEHLSKGVDNRTKTIMTYKKQGKLGINQTIKNLLSLIYKKFYHKKSVLDFVILEFTNYYDFVWQNKQYVVFYLEEAKNIFDDENITNLAQYEIDLFEREIENWSKLGKCYSKFLEKGIFMSLPRANMLMNEMEALTENIIAIEQAIISGPS
jgi:hypothetical protein